MLPAVSEIQRGRGRQRDVGVVHESSSWGESYVVETFVSPWEIREISQEGEQTSYGARAGQHEQGAETGGREAADVHLSGGV